MADRSVPDPAATTEVERLARAYGDAVTRRAWPDVAALFEPEAVVHIDTRTRPAFDLVGPAALTAFIERSLEPFAFFAFTILNQVAEVRGDDAVGRVMICELRHAHDGTWSQAFGLYRDRYRRTDGTWRFAGRRYASLARLTAPPGTVVESFGLPLDDDPFPPWAG